MSRRLAQVNEDVTLFPELLESIVCPKFGGKQVYDHIPEIN